MTVPPIGNLLAIFEAQISKNDQDPSEAFSATDGSTQHDGFYPKEAFAATISKATEETRHRQNAKRQGLADSIRDKVRMFDEGQVTIVRRASRELDFHPDEAEFDRSKSKIVFE